MKIVMFVCLVFCSYMAFGQGRSISLQPKIKEPIILFSNDTLKVGDVIELLEGSTEKGMFKFVQLLNNFNEPIGLANSRSAFAKQNIKFFKEQDGVVYAFTKFFCINIDAALKAKEIKSESIKNFVLSEEDNKPVKTDGLSKADRLRDLKKLLDEGILTQEEFDKEKVKILSE